MSKIKKQILYEAVQKNKTPNYIIAGALSFAGLLEQYQKEKAVYGHDEIEPSITEKELDKIIKTYMEG